MPNLLWLLALSGLLQALGCAQAKSHLREKLDDVLGIEAAEQREIVETTREIVLSPKRHGGMGWYLAAGANPKYEAGGGEIGLAVNHYWCDARLGLAANVSAAAERLFLGPTAALHFQLPTRIAPFIGLGAFAGYSRSQTPAASNGIDDNGDGLIDEWGETREHFDGVFASVFPEVGVHAWLTDSVRLSALASYHITTEGRRHDFWMVGGSVAILQPFSQFFK